jgi:hypothetical protein
MHSTIAGTASGACSCCCCARVASCSTKWWCARQQAHSSSWRMQHLCCACSHASLLSFLWSRRILPAARHCPHAGAKKTGHQNAGHSAPRPCKTLLNRPLLIALTRPTRTPVRRPSWPHKQCMHTRTPAAAMGQPPSHPLPVCIISQVVNRPWLQSTPHPLAAAASVCHSWCQRQTGLTCSAAPPLAQQQQQQQQQQQK